MKTSFIKTLACAVLFACGVTFSGASLASCSESSGAGTSSVSSIAKRGYSKYKDLNKNYLISIGGTGNEITYNSCNYVEITGSGTEDAGSLKGCVYYLINWTMTLGGNSSDKTVDVTYDSSSDYVMENKTSLYFTAYSLVSDGALSGKIGRL